MCGIDLRLILTVAVETLVWRRGRPNGAAGAGCDGWSNNYARTVLEPKPFDRYSTSHRHLPLLRSRPWDQTGHIRVALT